MAGLSQEQTNHILIRTGWVLLITHTVGMLICVPLWIYDVLSTRLTDIITNLLSWEAAILTALTFLIQAVTKRDVNDDS